MMWKWICTMMVAWGTIGSLQVQSQVSVTGDWDMRLTTQTGVTTWHAHFEQDGQILGGEIDLGDNEVLSVDGVVEGTMLKFVIVVPDLDGDQPINFEGELSGDTIKGEDGSFSWYGTGAWEASRQ